MEVVCEAPTKVEYGALSTRDYALQVARDTWTRRALIRLALIVGIVIAAQVLFTRLVPRTPPTRPPIFRWSTVRPTLGKPAVGAATHYISVPRPEFSLGFGTSLGTLLQPGYPVPSGFNLFETVVSALIRAALQFVLPAYAALTIAPLRKHRELAAILKRGLSPAQVLLGRGIGVLAPFIVALGIQTLLSIAGTVSSFQSRMHARVSSTSDEFGLQLAAVALGPVVGLLMMAMMVSISALSRRIWSATAGGYAVQLILRAWFSAATAGIALLISGGTWDPRTSAWIAVSPEQSLLFQRIHFLPPLFIAIAAALLWPAAIRSLKRAATPHPETAELPGG